MNRTQQSTWLLLCFCICLQDLQSRLREAQEAQQALAASRAEAARLREEAAAAEASTAELVDGLRVSHIDFFHYSPSLHAIALTRLHGVLT